MTLATFKLFVDICSVMTLFMLVLCLYRFRSRDREVQLLAINFFASLVVSALIELGVVNGQARNIPQNIWVLLMVIVLLMVYDVAWNRRYRTLTIISACIFCAFGFWNILFGQGNSFNSYTIALGGLIILVHSLVYFYHLLVKLPVLKLERLPMFWFNASFLFYFASSLFIFAAYVIDVFSESLLLYWTFQNVLRIVQFILIIVGLWQDLRNIRLRSSLASGR